MPRGQFARKPNGAQHEIDYGEWLQYAVMIGGAIVKECRNRANAMMCARDREGARVYDRCARKFLT